LIGIKKIRFNKIMEIKNFTDIKSLFFDNITAKQTIIKNTFWLSLAEVIGKLLKVILLIYIARILGATDFGRLSFALSFLGIFIILPNLIHAKIATREFSKDKEEEKEFNSIFTLRLFLSLLNLLFIFGILFFTNFDAKTTAIMFILAGYVVSEHFLGFLSFFFESRQRMEFSALTKIVQTILTAFFVGFTVFKLPSLENISYGYLFSSLAALIFFLAFLKIKFCPLGLSFKISVWKKYMMMSWPFFASSCFAAIYDQIDSVIMGSLGQITQTGLYGAAYKVAGGIFIPVALISGSFYPALNKAFGESKEKFQKVLSYFFESMIILAIPVILGGIILAPKIIGFLYGSSYSGSVLALRILLIMVGITFLQNPFYQIILIFGHQTKLFWASVFGAIASVILNLILIPKYSLYGAAVVSTVSAFLVLLVFVMTAKHFAKIRIFNFKLLRAGILAIFSSLLMTIFISSGYLSNLHVILLVVIGGLAYFTAFFIFKILFDKTTALIGYEKK
jgi:O-antigen/teichoic acid export membrane protein